MRFIDTRARVLAIAALLLCSSIDTAAAPPPSPASADGADEGPTARAGPVLLAQRRRVRRRRQRTKAALRRLRRLRRKRQQRGRRGRAKLRLKAPEVSPTSKPTGDDWGVKLDIGIKRLHLLYTTDIYGRFAWPGCGERATDRAHIGHLIATVNRRRAEIARSGGGKPLVLAGGDMTQPDLLGQEVFASHRLAPVAVDLLRRVGFDATSVGLFDFCSKRQAFRRYLEQMNHANVPVLAANIGCTLKERFPCRHFGHKGKPYVVVERGGVKIGVLGLSPDNIRARVYEHLREGLTSVYSVDAARKVIRKLRKQEKVEFVVVLATLNTEADTPLPVLDFVRRLGPDDAPEVVISNNMFERGTDNYMAHIRRGSGPVIIGTDRYGQTLGEVIVYYRRGKKGELQIDNVGIHRHEVADTKPAPEDKARVERMVSTFCGRVDQTIRGAHFTSATSYRTFHDYMMEIMRETYKAEVTLFNESGVDDSPFPVEGKLTREFLLRTLRTVSKVGTFWITGARLKELLKPHFDEQTSLRSRGVTREGGVWKVNGRALVVDRQYRVVTTNFVATGGDGLISLSAAERFSKSDATLRQTVIDFFTRGETSKRDGDPSISLEDDFADLSKQWLLSTTFNAGFSFNTVMVQNGPDNIRYNPPLLRRDHTDFAYKFDAGLTFSATSAKHLLQARGELQFGNSSNTTFTSDATATAAEDKINASDYELELIDRYLAGLTYRLQALRPYFNDRWYALEPYAEGILSGEFTPSGSFIDSSNSLQSYLYADLSASLGLGIRPSSLLFVKAGFATRAELFTPDEFAGKIDGPVGVYAGYVLDKWAIVSSPNVPLSLSSRLDFYFTGFGSDQRAELQVASKLAFGIFRWLSLKVEHRLFLIDNAKLDHSMANDLTIGFDLAFEYRRQTY